MLTGACFLKVFVKYVVLVVLPRGPRGVKFRGRARERAVRNRDRYWLWGEELQGGGVGVPIRRSQGNRGLFPVKPHRHEATHTLVWT